MTTTILWRVESDTSPLVSANQKAQKSEEKLGIAVEATGKAQKVAKGEAAEASRILTTAEKRALRAYERLAGELSETERESQKLAKARRVLGQAVKRGFVDEEKYQQLLEEAERKYDAQEAAIREVRRQFDALEQELDETARATRQYEERQEQLTKALKAGIVSQKRYNELLKKAQREAGGTGSRYAGVAAAFKKLAAGAGIATAAGLVLREALQAVGAALAPIARAGDIEERLTAQLRVALSSQEKALDTIDRIRKLAAPTPLGVEQLTEGWVKLQNFGLKPSEERLLSIGDLASAMNKDFDQAVEALLDASSLEFERLKEFGIRASKQGDKASITFKGLTQTVEASGQAVVDAILEISKQNFEGSLSAQATTLSGKLSTLKDSWDLLMAAIFRAGVGDVLKGAVGAATNLVSKLQLLFESEESLEKVLARNTPAWKKNTTAVLLNAGARQALANANKRLAEGDELILALEDQKRISEEIDEIREAQSNPFAGSLSDPLNSTTGRLEELEKALEKNRIRVDEAREAVKLMGRIYKQTQGDIEGWLGVTDKGNELTAEQKKALAAARAELDRFNRQLGRLEATPFAVHIEELERLKEQLKDLEKNGLKIDAKNAEAQIASIRSAIQGLDGRIKDLSKIQLFDESLLRESEVLEELLRRLQDAGRSLNPWVDNLRLIQDEAEFLEPILQQLQSLGLEFDKDNARILEEKARAILRNFETRIRELTEIDVVDVVGTGTGDLTAGDPTEESFRTSPILVDVDTDEMRKELKKLWAQAASDFGAVMLDALRTMAEQGKVSLRGIFQGLGGDLSGLAEVAGRTYAGIRNLGAEGTAQTVSQFQAFAGKATKYLTGFLAGYDIVTSFIEGRKWRRANRGALDLSVFEGEIVGELDRAGRAVAEMLRSTGEEASDFVDEVLRGLDGTLQALGRSARLEVSDGDQYSVVINGAIREFGSAYQEAFDYLVVESLRAARIDGLSDEVARTLRYNDADSLQELDGLLSLADEIAKLDFTDAQRAFEDFELSFERLVDFAVDQRLELDSLTRIGADTARQILDLRRQITGDQPSESQLREQQRLEFNEALPQYLDEILVEIARLEQGIGALPDITRDVADGVADGVERFGRVSAAGLEFILENGALAGATTAATIAAQRAALEGQLAAFRELYSQLSAAGTIAPGEIRVSGSGRGRERRERREDFALELSDLRLLALGATDVGMAFRQQSRALRKEAEELRRAGVVEDLIQEWITLEREIQRTDLVGSIRDRLQSLGSSDVEQALRQITEAYEAQREELTLLGASERELAEVEALRRKEIEALIEAQEAQRQQYSDLAAGISPWQRQLLDLQGTFAQWERDTRDLIAASSDGSASVSELAAALAELESEQSAAADALFGDLLQALDSAGVEVPGLAESLIDLQFAMLRADVAAAALQDGFADFLAGTGTTLDQLLANIDAAEQAARDALGDDETTTGPSFDNRADSAAEAAAREMESALDAVSSALDQLLGRDRSATAAQSFQDLQSRYLEALALAQDGDTDAIRKVSQLALQLEEAGGSFAGTAGGFYSALFDQLTDDLEGLEDFRVPTLEETAAQQLTVLEQIRDQLSVASLPGVVAPQLPTGALQPPPAELGQLVDLGRQAATDRRAAREQDERMRREEIQALRQLVASQGEQIRILRDQAIGPPAGTRR